MHDPKPTTESAVALRARRAALGLTQSEAAERLGLTRSSVAFLETGRWLPSADRLAALLARYDELELDL